MDVVRAKLDALRQTAEGLFDLDPEAVGFNTHTMTEMINANPVVSALHPSVRPLMTRPSVALLNIQPVLIEGHSGGRNVSDFSTLWVAPVTTLFPSPDGGRNAA